MAIRRVEISRTAQKELHRLPRHIVDKLHEWVLAVSHYSLEQVRKLPGYHDEPLKGQRFGQRSIRLSRGCRAIYTIKKDGSIEFICIEEVNRHEY